MLFVLKTTFTVSGIGLDMYAIAQSHQFGNWSKGNYIPTFWVIRCNLLIVGSAATLQIEGKWEYQLGLPEHEVHSFVIFGIYTIACHPLV